MAKKGRIKTGAVLINGKESVTQMGRFQIRYFAGAKTMYKNAGKDTVETSFLLWCG